MLSASAEEMDDSDEFVVFASVSIADMILKVGFFSRKVFFKSKPTPPVNFL